MATANRLKNKKKAADSPAEWSQDTSTPLTANNAERRKIFNNGPQHTQ